MTGSRPGLLIGDFARRCRLPVSTLRYYDRIGLLVPAVVDPVSGYRRYTVDQLASAVLVARLRAIGTPPRTIASVVAGGAQAVTALAGERRRIEGQIRDAQGALRQIDDLLAHRHGPGDDLAELVELGEEHVVGVPVLAAQADLGSAVVRGVAALRSALRRAGCARTPPWGATFPLQITEHVSGFVFTRTAQAVDHPSLAVMCLPGGRAARTIHHGSPDTVWRAYRSAFDLIDQHGGRPTGPVVEEYLSLDAPATTSTSIRVTVPLAA